MKLPVLAILAAVAGAGLVLLFSGVSLGLPRRVSEQREVMGSPATITVYDRSVRAAKDAIDAAFDRASDVYSAASSTDEASELSELNRASYLAAPSDELVEMLRLSFLVSELSAGAYDVTIGILLDLWQSGGEGAGLRFSDLAPTLQETAISEALRHVGMARILLGSGRPASITLVPGTRVDLGWIARGYAVDQAIDTLRQAGVGHACVEAGTVVRAYGGRRDGSPWVVALPNPENPDEALARFEVMDGAIATAGSYERFFDASAEMECVLDPRTGYPATALSSATVIAPTCAEANALAYTVLILGAESGVELVERFASIEALVVGFDDPKEVKRSSGVDAFETRAEDRGT
jgi:FAD:protein FMN transferase